MSECLENSISKNWSYVRILTLTATYVSSTGLICLGHIIQLLQTLDSLVLKIEART